MPSKFHHNDRKKKFFLHRKILSTKLTKKRKIEKFLLSDIKANTSIFDKFKSSTYIYTSPFISLIS